MIISYKNNVKRVKLELELRSEQRKNKALIIQNQRLKNKVKRLMLRKEV